MSPHDDTDRLSAAALAAGEPTSWFEKLYAEAEAGTAEVPWDRPQPTALLVSWAAQTGLTGAGRGAMVVGCGHGRDAEFIASLGFTTTAFDISETAIRTARSRHPGTTVDYQVGDLLDLPAPGRGGFDLVVESNNVQALPRDLRPRATGAVVSLVAPGGTLLVLAAAATAWGEAGPPWPLTRADIEAFAFDGLTATSIEEIPAEDDPLVVRWRAVFERPA
jgi:SAM-dependent methyltransferase